MSTMKEQLDRSSRNVASWASPYFYPQQHAKALEAHRVLQEEAIWRARAAGFKSYDAWIMAGEPLDQGLEEQ